MEGRPKCRTTSSDTTTVSEYQYVSYKIFQSSYAIEDPTKFPTYRRLRTTWFKLGCTRDFSIEDCVGKWRIMRSPKTKELLFLILTHTKAYNSQRRQYVPPLYRTSLDPLSAAPNYQGGRVPLPTNVNI